MARRSNGQGTIIPHMRDGKQHGWQGQIMLPNGTRKSVYGKIKRDVEQKIRQIQREIEGGYHGTRDAETALGVYLTQWVDIHEGELEPKTVSGYRGIIRNRLGTIAQMPLNDLRPAHLQRLYAELLTQYSPTTVNHTHNMLSGPLRDAVLLGLIPRNPCDLADPPAIKTKEFVTLTREQVKKLLNAAHDDPLGALIAVAVTTGMREAEILGMTWDALDFERKTITVAHTLHRIDGVYQLRKTKSRTSRRTLQLAPSVIRLLQNYRIQQEKDRTFVGDAWQREWDALVWRNQIGGPLHFSLAIRHHDRLSRTLGLPDVRFHDLRHTFATLLIEDGVPIHVVSMLLGHSSVGITLQTYAHVTPRMHDQANATIQSWLPDLITEDENDETDTMEDTDDA